MKIKHGDSVVVVTGKDKGKTGQVLKVLPNKNRVVVTDINMRTRHIKAAPNRPGEIVKYEASINVSNVMLIDPKSKKRSRVGYKIDEKGKKVRIAKQSGEAVKKGVISKAKEQAVKEKDSKSTPKATTQAKSKAGDSKSPFWKKMGFGAEEMDVENAEVDTGTHMKEDHSVPDQIERSSTRGSSRGS